MSNKSPKTNVEDTSKSKDLSKVESKPFSQRVEEDVQQVDKCVPPVNQMTVNS